MRNGACSNEASSPHPTPPGPAPSLITQKAKDALMENLAGRSCVKRKELVHAIHLTKSNLMVEIKDYGQERPLPSFKQNRPGSDYFNSNWSVRNMNIINPTQKGQSKVYLYD